MKWETVRRRTRVRIMTVSVWSSLIAFVVAGLIAVLAMRLRSDFFVVYDTTERYITCARAAREMQEGSTYLTEQARLFTLAGKKKYLQNYLTEVNETRRRELSVEVLQEQFPDSSGLPYIFSAMDRSQDLMHMELYMMRLMLEATDDDPSGWPQELLDIQLSEADAALSKDKMIARAQRLLRDDEYENSKDLIYQYITKYRDILVSETKEEQTLATEDLKFTLQSVEHGAVLLLLILFLSWWLIFWLLVRPITRYIKNIQRGEPLPVQGAVELREVFSAYNAAREESQEAQRMIRREAEHDPLTDLLNRRHFERTLDAYKQGNTPFALIIVDIDNFKTINDTFGHSTGDALIKRVASTLDGAFRNVDHVCRIGGDEFTVIVTDMVKKNGAAILEKINWINEELSVPADGVPAVSLSVGVAFADGKREADKIFEKADQALYQVKENGRNGCVIY